MDIESEKKARRKRIAISGADDSRKEPSIMDFCGIWDKDYPSAEEIRIARTSNTFPEL